MSNFKRYDKYKDSGIEWIGEIPEEWKVNKIKFTTYLKGRIGWQGLRADEFIDDGPYLVTGTDFVNGEINWDSCYHISMERYNEAPPIQLKENDLLVTKDGTIGKVAIVKNKPKYAILNSGIFLIRPTKSSYLIKFMYWILNSQLFDAYIKYVSLGSTIVHLYQQTFENFSFHLPSLDEQISIANFLDQKTAEIDDLITDKEKLIELLQEKRQAVITEAVTKGLNPNVKMKDSGIEWIGDIPEGWEVKKLKYVTKFAYGDSLPVDEREAGDIDVFGSNGKIGTHAVSNTSSPVVIVGRKGSYGKVTYVEKECFAIDTTYYIDNRCTTSNIKWLYYLLTILELDKNSQDTGVPGLSREYTYNKYVFLPPLDEQISITNFLDQKTAEIDSLVSEIQEQIQKLKEYRQALIFEAVTGKIDVRDYATVS